MEVVNKHILVLQDIMKNLKTSHSVTILKELEKHQENIKIDINKIEKKSKI